MSKKLTKEFFKEAQTYAQKIVDGLNTSVSPFHSVETAKKLLNAADFKEIRETDKWELEGGSKYYFTRNNSTICAFTIGSKVQSGSPPESFKIVGCHTDSPTIRVAPVSNVDTQGYKEIAIQWYGGALWHTWLDRDLTFAGRVIVYNETTGKLEDKFWHHEEPIVRIPNMCPHLQTMKEREALELNKETHLKPIIATSIIDALMDKDIEEEKKGDEEEKESKFSIEKKHLKSFLNLMAEGVGTKAENIVDFELSMVDTNKSCIMGLHKEFISSGRLDNMLSSLTATHALIEASSTVHSDSSVNIIYLFDHEEIGSTSDQGAQGTVVKDSLERIYASFNDQTINAGFKQTLRNSMCISADMAHAIHPNYQQKHQPLHCPKMHEGIVLKTNCNQRYMTDSVSSAVLREIASRAGVPLQDFVIKQDLPCGSTIGPALASVVGVKTVDIGAPQLAMHSCRELCGTTDTYYYHLLFAEFFKSFNDASADLLTH
jgi:aspartyl aminopeptidase